MIFFSNPNQVFLLPKLKVVLVTKPTFPVNTDVYFEKTLSTSRLEIDMETDTWKLIHLKLMLEGYMEHHSLKSRSTDQSALF